jgi:hypothetical protein
MDEDVQMTEPASGEISDEEFYADAMDWEVELAELQARAARNAERARAIADNAQNAAIRDEAENRVSLMNKFSNVAAEMGQGARQGAAQGIMELYNVAKNRSLGEWGAGAAMAVLSIFPQIVTGPGAQAIVLGGVGGAALGLTVATVADSLYRLGGFLSVMANSRQAQAALTLAEDSLQYLKDTARGMITDVQLSDADKLQLQLALEELERREAWRMRAEQQDQEAIRVLRAMRKRERPLEQYPDPGLPFIEEVTEGLPTCRQRLAIGGGQPAIGM